MRQVVNCTKEPGPVSESVLLILISLAEEPRHGYAILRDVERISNSRVKMSTGTLYGALHRLLADGWIERLASEDTVRDKQFYRLTSNGAEALAAEVARIKSLAKLADARLTPPIGLRTEPADA